MTSEDRQFLTAADLFRSPGRLTENALPDDNGTFGPPFFVIFAVVFKVIVSIALALFLISVLALTIDQFVYSFTD